MDIFFNNIWAWLVVLACLGFLYYAAKVIKKEKEVAFTDGIPLHFHGFEFLVPPWWTKTRDEVEHIEFERRDTRYDWKATFNWITTEKNLQNVFEDEVIHRKIIFDKDTSIINDPPSLSNLSSLGIEAMRVEGTATQDQEYRIYYDAFIIKSGDGVLFLESRSSILNGLLEGPFFEQAILNLKVLPSVD